MRFRPPYKSQRTSVSSKMHDCTAQHNSISIKVYFLERVAPLLLALVLFWLRPFWEVAPLNINLNGEIQRDEASSCEEIHMEMQTMHYAAARQNCFFVTRASVWIVEFGLSEAHCGGFSKSRENSWRPDVIHRHSSDVRRWWEDVQLMPCRWIWTTIPWYWWENLEWSMIIASSIVRATNRNLVDPG